MTIHVIGTVQRFSQSITLTRLFASRAGPVRGHQQAELHPRTTTSHSVRTTTSNSL
jgi:hypothetical protein